MKALWFIVAVLATPLVPFLSEGVTDALLTRAGRGGV